MLEIGICDDDIFLAGYLDEEISGMANKRNIKMSVEVFRDGKEIADEVKSGRRFDLIFMDIRMAVVNGLEAADTIREVDRIVQLIYVTSHDCYMKDAFHSGPIGFLQKPIRLEELEKLFLHAIHIIGKMDAYYRFRFNRMDYKIMVRDILYCESHKRETEMVTEQGVYKVLRKLDLVEEGIMEQNGNFIRIHESYLVNYRHVVTFTYDSVILSNGEKLPVSRSRVKVASKILRSMLGEG